ncbi:uncharacterized protein LOC133420651 isoform X2 [Cololabis saira]|uniref:uncharacterized protein LOC133420651 isoform X2 n=1 Tax=Cololabis saira TaxID=129043 RepID=UPI002AD3A2BA|nr:uncharacterized protein LOC133420651 isoform X2 [Cololabis saira]
MSVSRGGLYSCRGRRGNPRFFTKHSEIYFVEKSLSNRVDAALQHNWTQIFSGEKISIRCEVQGGEKSGWYYEWRTTSPNTPPTESDYSFAASVSHRGTYWCKGRRGLYSSTTWSSPLTLAVSDKPRPRVVADKRTIPVGGSVTLTCSVMNSTHWSYYWSSHTSNFSKINIRGGGIQDNIVSILEGGVYSCRGGRGNPLFFTEDSNVVIIEKIVSNEVVVSLKPNWPLMFTGEMFTVTCEVYGGGNTEWVYEWSAPNSVTVSTYDGNRIFNASESSSGNYRCMGKHKQDSYSSTEWSNSVTLKVLGNRPRAQVRAGSSVFPEGGSVTLTCSVEPPSSGWQYHWYRSEKTSEAVTELPGDSWSHKEITVSQEGLYWCRGARGDPVYYTDDSDSISVGKTATTSPAVTLQPNWPEIHHGEAITLRCEIQGRHTEWAYEWMTTSSYTPPDQQDYKIASVSHLHHGHYWCKGRLKSAPQNATRWTAAFELTVVDWRQAVLTVSPSWLNAGASVTLRCGVRHPSAGFKFYWYKALPIPYIRHFGARFRVRFGSSYRYEPLPGSINGTFQDVYILHGQTNTAAFVCRAGRGDPVVYSHYSDPAFVWSADFHSSASLVVYPPRVQHFTSESVLLRCEGNSTEWSIASVPDSFYYCDYDIMRGSCTIRVTRPYDAVYWCESETGDHSNAVNITVVAGDVILVSPIHLVHEGTSVTLGCKLRTQNFTSAVVFDKNDKRIQDSSRPEMKIAAATQSDEGFYRCEHSGEASPPSWMSVKPSTSPSPVWLSVGLVCGLLVAFLLTLLLFCCCRRSNGTACNRLLHCHKSGRTSGRVQTADRDESQQKTYASLLYSDRCVYDTVGGSDSTDNGGGEYEDGNVHRHIELRSVGRTHPTPASDSSSVYII